MAAMPSEELLRAVTLFVRGLEFYTRHLYGAGDVDAQVRGQLALEGEVLGERLDVSPPRLRCGLTDGRGESDARA
ncbi:MAG: hypothetical protein EOO70_03440 [Myxococcaceae bacterium]|nr:MAG: hypothetical protein EOO70_03440 [Myxococcaceae bacterium]